MLKGIVRRWTKVFPSGGRFLRLTNIESLAGAQVELPLTELARAGRLFHGGSQDVSLTAVPTQTIPLGSVLILYNGEQPGGLNYYVYRANFFLISGTASAGASLFLARSQSELPRTSFPTVMFPGYGVNNSSGANRSSNALWSSSFDVVNITGANRVATNWTSFQSVLQPASAGVGLGNFGNMGNPFRGSICIPPRYGLGFAIVSGAGTTPQYGFSAQWAELEGDLEP